MGGNTFEVFFLQVRHFVVFKNFIVMMMVLACLKQCNPWCCDKKKTTSLMASLVVPVQPFFIENNHLGGSKNEIMEVQRRRFMYI